MITKRAILPPALILLLFLYYGCGTGLPVTFEGIGEIDYSKWETGRPGGEMTISVKTDPKSFNIVTANESSTLDVLNRVYAAVVDRDMLTLEWSPSLAERWEISEDGLSATFFMRKGLAWSDGAPLTAEDVVWSVNEVYYSEELATNVRDQLFVGDSLARVEKTGDNAFTITTKVVYADIVSLANIQPVPKHVLEPVIAKDGIKAIKTFWGADTDVKSVVGSGPFVVSEYVPNQRAVLARNPRYWKKDSAGNSLPYLDRINLVITENADTAVLKLIAGEIDAVDKVRGENVASLMDEKSKQSIRLYNAGPEASSNFIVFNENRKTVAEPKSAWFNDRKFREAMARLVDRKSIIDNVYFGFAYPQYSFVPRLSPYYWPDADAAAPGYDPAKAKRILDSLDLVDRDGDGIREDKAGNDVSFVIETNADSAQRVKIGQIIAEEMKKAGVSAVFKPTDLNAIVTALTGTLEWEAIIIGLSGSIEPFLGWSNVIPSRGGLHLVEPNQEKAAREWEKNADALYAENTTTVDAEKRKRTGFDIQRIWIEEQPWTYTVNEAGIYAFAARIGNAKPRSVDPYAGWRGIAEYLYVKSSRNS